MDPELPDPADRWAAPRRTHALSPVVGLLPAFKQGLGVVVLALAIGFPWLVAIVAAGVLVSGLAGWWRRTWSFDGELIVLDEGVLERRARRVPVGRIQQVELVQPLTHRLLGLAALRVETAGGAAGSGVRLDALRRVEAEALRLSLLSARARARAAPSLPPEADPPPAPPPGGGEPHPPPPIPAPPPVEERVLELSTPRIMLAGVTSSTLLVVGAVSMAVVDLLGDLPDQLADSVEDGAQSLVESLNWATGAAVFVAVVALAAAAGSVAVHHRLTVVRAGDELRMWRGLFERKDAVLPLARVQAVVIRQNPAQRALGMATVRMRSAGGAGTQDSVTVPLADRDQIARLVEAATGTSVELDGLVPAPRPSLPRRIVRRLALAAVLVGAIVVVLRPGREGVAAVVLVATSAAVGLGFDAHRNLGFRVDADHVVVRWGSLVRRTAVVAIDRVQSTRIAASPMQRRVGLATMTLDLAGAGARPTIIDQRPGACRHLDAVIRHRALRSAEVASGGGRYATLGASLQPTPNEEP